MTIQGKTKGVLLAIDYGTKRIGLAKSDSNQILATPYKVAKTLKEVLAAIDEIKPAALIMGYPLKNDGTRNPVCDNIDAFAKLLEEKTNLKVYFQDERFSSLRAEEYNIAKEKLDAVAASIILSDFLTTKS
jgi:putative holliday junction resolvase